MRGDHWRAEERRELEVIGTNCKWEMQKRMAEEARSEEHYEGTKHTYYLLLILEHSDYQTVNLTR